jgi:hypothetical protein
VSKFDFANVLKLDRLELRPVGPRDVHLRILAWVSGGSTTSTTRSWQTPTESRRAAVARSTPEIPLWASSRSGCGSEALPRRRHCAHTLQQRADAYGFPAHLWAYDQPDSIGWYAEKAVVR